MKKFLLFVLTVLTLSAAAAQDWPAVNHDNVMSRNSPQTAIGKSNVNQLQVKWVLNTGYPVENSPLIVGDKAFAQNNAMQVIAMDLKTGMNLWKFDPNVTVAGSIPRATNAHGMIYENGIVYADTGPNATVVALNASDGSKIWESEPLLTELEIQSGSYRIQSPVMIWRDSVIVGNSLGDSPPFGFPARGFLAALDKKDGKQLWRTFTAVGAWVEGNNTTMNGGATPWTGGAIDNETGIIYVPCGNAAPDFSAQTRPSPNLYAFHVIAVNLTDGKILWYTPFIADGGIMLKPLNLTVPDTHDWDPDFGANIVTVNINGTMQKVVIGHDKHGDVMAMNASTGKPIWWNALGVMYRGWAQPAQNGSGVVWPGTQNGIESFSAVDANNVYLAVANTGVIYYINPDRTAPAFDAMPNGIGNGSVAALDLKTGKIKWETKTDFPTWCSPIVTNGLVFSGHVTATGKPYEHNEFAAATNAPLISSGIIMALDKDTGKELWEFNVGAPIGIGGPSIGNGYLLVPTGSPAEIASNQGGYIIAFGLPGK